LIIFRRRWFISMKKPVVLTARPMIDRRQVTGGQKMGENCHFAILSKADEKSLEDQLAFVLPAHEYVPSYFPTPFLQRL
jgi:hypothetical protein